MRRKTSPAPFQRHHGRVRALLPARSGSLLPTAASIALALMSGCSTPTLDVIAADPVTTKASPLPAPSPSPTPSAVPYIDPEPYELEGKIPNVKPTVGGSGGSVRPHK